MPYNRHVLKKNVKDSEFDRFLSKNVIKCIIYFYLIVQFIKLYLDLLFYLHTGNIYTKFIFIYNF